MNLLPIYFPDSTKRKRGDFTSLPSVLATQHLQLELQPLLLSSSQDSHDKRHSPGQSPETGFATQTVSVKQSVRRPLETRISLSFSLYHIHTHTHYICRNQIFKSPHHYFAHSSKSLGRNNLSPTLVLLCHTTL